VEIRAHVDFDCRQTTHTHTQGSLKTTAAELVSSGFLCELQQWSSYYLFPCAKAFDQPARSGVAVSGECLS